MPYIVRPPHLRKALAVCGAVLLVGAVPAQAATTEKNACEAPVLSQPLLSAGDANYYFMPAGESANNFAGTGWSLSGGASIQQVTLANGSSGAVLDLPSGAQAVSPVICVTNEYPFARFAERQVNGTEGVNFYVSYLTSQGWSNRYGGQVRGKGNGWTLSQQVAMQPSKTGGWQLAEIILTGAGKSNDFQVYNLYIDPYRR
jgi:hypothetical protein